MAGAAGGYAVAGGHASETVDLASATHHASPNVPVTACMSSGKLTLLSATAAKCPANSTAVHWTAQSGRPAATGQHHTTVTACLSSGQLTRISTAAVKCPANSAAVHWTAQSGRSGSTSQPVTVTACLSSGALTQISTTAVKCPAHSIRVRWGAQHGTAPASGPQPGPSTSATSPGSPSGTATSTGMPSSGSGTPTASPSSSTPKPDPSTTSPTSAPTTSTPSPSQSSSGSATWAKCTSAAFGQWNTPDGRFDLYNNEWNSGANPGPQTLCGNTAGDWQVTSTQRAGNTAVLTYPSVQLNYNGTSGYALSKFTSMTSSWAENMHAVSGTDAEAAYDIWINGLNKEVMVWVDNHGQTPAGSKVATTTISGATWDLYETGDRGYMAFVREGNATSGTVDLLAALKFLQSRGDLSASDVLWQANFGFEICSTGGAAETFTVSNFSLDSNPSS